MIFFNKKGLSVFVGGSILAGLIPVFGNVSEVRAASTCSLTESATHAGNDGKMVQSAWNWTVLKTDNTSNFDSTNAETIAFYANYAQDPDYFGTEFVSTNTGALKTPINTSILWEKSVDSQEVSFLAEDNSGDDGKANVIANTFYIALPCTSESLQIRATVGHEAFNVLYLANDTSFGNLEAVYADQKDNNGGRGSLSPFIKNGTNGDTDAGYEVPVTGQWVAAGQRIVDGTGGYDSTLEWKIGNDPSDEWVSIPASHIASANAVDVGLSFSDELAAARSAALDALSAAQSAEGEAQQALTEAQAAFDALSVEDQTTAQTHLDSATQAKTDATAAVATAQAASNAADATSDLTTANTEKEKALAAQTAAETARTTANSARDSIIAIAGDPLQEARDAAKEAETKAKEASEKATEALTAAQAAFDNLSTEDQATSQADLDKAIAAEQEADDRYNQAILESNSAISATTVEEAEAAQERAEAEQAKAEAEQVKAEAARDAIVNANTSTLAEVKAEAQAAANTAQAAQTEVQTTAAEAQDVMDSYSQEEKDAAQADFDKVTAALNAAIAAYQIVTTQLAIAEAATTVEEATTAKEAIVAANITIAEEKEKAVAAKDAVLSHATDPLALARSAAQEAAEQAAEAAQSAQEALDEAQENFDTLSEEQQNEAQEELDKAITANTTAQNKAIEAANDAQSAAMAATAVTAQEFQVSAEEALDEAKSALALVTASANIVTAIESDVVVATTPAGSARTFYHTGLSLSQALEERENAEEPQREVPVVIKMGKIRAYLLEKEAKENSSYKLNNSQDGSYDLERPEELEVLSRYKDSLGLATVIPKTGEIEVPDVLREKYSAFSIVSGVSERNAYYEAILSLYHQGVVEIIDGEAVSPDRYIERSDFAKIILIAGEETLYNYSQSFNDIESEDVKYIENAVAQGFIEVTGDDFRPSKPMTIGQAAKGVARAFDIGEDISSEEAAKVLKSYNLFPKGLIGVELDEGIAFGEVAEMIYRGTVMVDNSLAQYYDTVSVDIPHMDIEIEASRTLLQHSSSWLTDLTITGGALFEDSVTDNTIIFAHSSIWSFDPTPYGPVFKPLIGGTLTPGNTVSVNKNGTDVEYTITQVELVSENDIEALRAKAPVTSGLILFTCDTDISDRWVYYGVQGGDSRELQY